MKYYHFVFLFFTLSLIFPGQGRAQISQGGEPMRTFELKSSRKKMVELPPIQNFISTEDNSDSLPSDYKLKRLRFAYPFEVNLTPNNSGEWPHGENGYAVWKLTIRSVGAKSLNLIFDDFNIPENARLFILSETEKHILGAFTSYNNNPSGKFAVSPVAGDEITVQYEIPETETGKQHFTITRVNHDYLGILKSGGRRPLNKIALWCNINVNCDDWFEWEEVKNSVVRIIIDGTTFCSGALLNNTAQNQKPYVLSAAHCYERKEYAQTSVYAFNYESPFCESLDGDPLNSISGALMKAQSDSADFALVELNQVPPPDFRPYYAGWNRSVELNDSSVSIHHPQADVKKLSFDKDVPVISSFELMKKPNGFLKISKWDKGLTEHGSSGGPLFDSNKRLIGTLSGGDNATCSSALNDYFERFATSWEHKPDSAKQLKYWLDPIKSGVQVLDGMQFYEGEDHCGAFTNLNDGDEYSLVPLISSNKFAGYWGGSNSVGITEIVERFSISGNETLSGVSLGVGKFKNIVKSTNSEIKIKVYNGTQFPEQLIYSQTVKTAGLAADAMNFIGFYENIAPDEVFFVGFELSNIQPLDSFAVYQSLRTATEPNTFFFFQNNKWYNFKEANPTAKSIANIFELVACNFDNLSTDTPDINSPMKIYLFPNPVNSRFTLETTKEIVNNQVSIYNILGQKVEFKTNWINNHKLSIDLTGNVPGVYFVRFEAGNKFYSSKISFVPW